MSRTDQSRAGADLARSGPRGVGVVNGAGGTVELKLNRKKRKKWIATGGWDSLPPRGVPGGGAKGALAPLHPNLHGQA